MTDPSLVTMYQGKRLEEMTREELIEAIQGMAAYYQEERAWQRRKEWGLGE